MGLTPFPRLRRGPWARALAGLHRARSNLALDRWFPHVPIALGALLLGLSGAWHIILAAAQDVGRANWHLQDLLVSNGTALPRGGVLELLADVSLVAMSVGLALRSRLAWTVALTLVSATLTLAVSRGAVSDGAREAFSGGVLLALLVFRRSFSRSSLAAATLFTLVSIVLLFAYAGFGAYVLGDGFSPKITNLPTAFYFAVVTMSTVGYGDIVPKSNDARLFVVSIIILGITVFATSLSAVLMPVINRRMKQLLAGDRRHMARTKHYIVVGDTSLAHSTYRELKARNLPVTVILARAADTDWVNQGDLVSGDPTDIETLKAAGAPEAVAVLALREDDRENAFIVLAMKELGCGAHTVVSVRDSKNLVRVRRVGPDMIIAPDVLGGELLAMALNGEELNGDALLSKIFRVEAETDGQGGG